MKVAISLGITIGGIFGTYFLGKFITGWGNEVGNIKDEKEATEGRRHTDDSDQFLNTQTKKLPKD